MFQPIWVELVFQGTKTPVCSGCSAAPTLAPYRQAQPSGRKCYMTPAFSRVLNKRGKIKAQKSNKNQK